MNTCRPVTTQHLSLYMVTSTSGGPAAIKLLFKFESLHYPGFISIYLNLKLVKTLFLVKRFRAILILRQSTALFRELFFTSKEKHPSLTFLKN